jgi:hypothetical protein
MYREPSSGAQHFEISPDNNGTLTRAGLAFNQRLGGAIRTANVNRPAQFERKI